MKTPKCMCPAHPRFNEFMAALSWQVRECDHTTNTAQYLLAKMGFEQAFIRESMADLARRGGYCDCEILMNVGVDNE